MQLLNTSNYIISREDILDLMRGTEKWTRTNIDLLLTWQTLHSINQESFPGVTSEQEVMQQFDQELVLTGREGKDEASDF